MKKGTQVINAESEHQIVCILYALKIKLAGKNKTHLITALCTRNIFLSVSDHWCIK